MLPFVQIDHVVLWVDDPNEALAFYGEVLGFAPERVEEFDRGDAPFPSVRVNETTILDLMGPELVRGVRTATRGERSGGASVNHVCFSMSKQVYDDLMVTLRDRGIETSPGPPVSFGAQGFTTHSVYFSDPSGNVIEARYYE